MLWFNLISIIHAFSNHRGIEMILHDILRHLMTVLVVAFMGLSSTMSPVMAENYAGVYMGGFLGTADNGAFAVLIREDNSAVVMAYDSIDDFGFLNENITISSDGTFSENNIDGNGTNIIGTVTSTGISGTISGPSTGVFSGTKSSLDGPYSSHDGYYKGSFSTDCGIYGFGSGFFRTIVSADGQAYAYTEYTQSLISVLPVGSKDGGILSISGSTIYGTTVNGASVWGTVSGETVSGVFSFQAVCTGTFSGSLDYALNITENTIPIAAILLLLLD